MAPHLLNVDVATSRTDGNGSAHSSGQYRLTVLHPATTPGGRQQALIGDRGGALPISLAIDTINKHFLYGLWGSRTGIIRELEPGVLKRYNDSELRAEFSNIVLEVPVVDQDGVTTYEYGPALGWWMKHYKRRQYAEVVFDPVGTPLGNAYNLWRGLAVTPEVGVKRDLVRACRRMLQHLRVIICAGDGACFSYLLDWMGHLVQHPGVQMGVMPVLLSEAEGTGKSTIGFWLTKICGRHSQVVSDAEQLVGKFNANLEQCIFVLANELSFAGDHKTARRLKAFITDPWLRIEPKGIEAYQVRNITNTMLTSNASWAVPAGTDARRFFVLDVSTAKLGNTSYFDALYYEASHGGLEAFLAVLLSRDLSAFKPAAFPRTRALSRQQIKSLEPAAEWLMAVGQHEDGALGHPSGLTIDLPAQITFQTLAESCAQWSRSHNKHPPHEVELGGLLTKVVGARRRRAATHIQRNSIGWGFINRPNARCYSMPDGPTLLAALMAAKGVKL